VSCLVGVGVLQGSGSMNAGGSQSRSSVFFIFTPVSKKDETSFLGGGFPIAEDESWEIHNQDKQGRANALRLSTDFINRKKVRGA